MYQLVSKPQSKSTVLCHNTSSVSWKKSALKEILKDCSHREERPSDGNIRTHWSDVQLVMTYQQVMLLERRLLTAGNKAWHFLIVKGHLIAQIALPDNLSFIYWALMKLDSCLPLLDASSLLLYKWLISILNIVVDSYTNFKRRRYLWSWILHASPCPERWNWKRCRDISAHRMIKSTAWPLHQYC